MQVIIFHGKHGDTIFDGSTPEKRRAAKRKMLLKRLEEGWYQPFRENQYTYYKDTWSMLQEYDKANEDHRKVMETLDAYRGALKMRAQVARDHEEHNEFVREVNQLGEMTVEEAMNWIDPSTRDWDFPRYMIDTLYEFVEGAEYERYEVRSLEVAEGA